MKKLKIHPRLPDDGLSFEQVKEKLRKEIEKEHLYFYKNKTQIAHFVGESNYVNPSEFQLRKMKNCVVIHNHLHNSSFSFEDICAIITHNASEMYLICIDCEYFVKRPLSGWGFELFISENQEIKSDSNTIALLEESIIISEEFLNSKIRKGELYSSEKDNLLFHEIWQTFFLFKNVVYKKLIY
jgi:hypothetical protein